MRAHLSREYSDANLSSTLNFRTGSLLHMRPLKIWLNFESHGLHGLRAICAWQSPAAASKLWGRGAKIRYVSWSRLDPSTRVRGAVFEGFVARVRTSEPVAHKPLGARRSLLSSIGFSAAARTAACTDSHRQHVCDLVHKSPFTPVLCANRQRISCYGQIVTSSPSEQRTSPVSWTAGRTCFRGRGFLKESGGCTPSQFGWFGTSTGERRWICLTRVRRRTARCSSLCLTPR